MKKAYNKIDLSEGELRTLIDELKFEFKSRGWDEMPTMLEHKTALVKEGKQVLERVKLDVNVCPRCQLPFYPGKAFAFLKAAFAINQRRLDERIKDDSFMKSVANKIKPISPYTGPQTADKPWVG